MTAPTSARATTGPGRTWLAVHLATLAMAVPILVWVNRDQWFTADDWEVITRNGLGSNPTPLGLFAPHFEHWSTLGVLVYKALYGLFAMRSYWPYIAVLIAVILAVGHMMWRMLLRVGVVPAYATAVAFLAMVAAVGWENRSAAWQITIIGPVALGFGALLLMPERGPWQRRDLGVTALVLGGLMCSGVGVTMSVVVVLAALIRRGWRATLAIIAGPAVLYALWYGLEGTSGQRNTVALSTALNELPGFAWRGLTHAFSDLTRVADSGVLVLAAVVAWLAWKVWRNGVRREPWPLVVATTVGAVASVAITGLRRAGAPPVSRYSDIIVLLALPALALMTQEAGRALARRYGAALPVACTAVVVAFLVVQVVALDHQVSHAGFVGEMRPRVLATAQLLRDHEPIASTNIFGIPYLTEPSTTTIARLDRHGELPTLDASTADVLTAREYVETVIGDASRYPEGVVRSVTVVSGSSGAGEPGCLTIAPATPGTRPVVRVELPSAGAFRVATDPAAEASLSFLAGDARGRPRGFTTSPGGGVGVGVSRATDVELTLPATTTTLCGLGTATVTHR